MLLLSSKGCVSWPWVSQRISWAALSLLEGLEVNFLGTLPLVSQQEDRYAHYGEAIYSSQKRVRTTLPQAALQYAVNPSQR